jgi:glycosyltransferase involved in cell wall biosynthesis
VDKSFARHQLNLPQDKKIVAFHATGARRKGLHLLTPALEILAESELGSDVELAVLGGFHPKKSTSLSVKTHALGEIQDDRRLTLFYSAIDVFVLPSTEDNLPNTIMEAFACGTPCVAFSIGGVPDMIDHATNGYLCRPFESPDLADGISWVLDNEVRRKNLSANARQKVLKEYSPKLIADQYLDLYQQILK